MRTGRGSAGLVRGRDERCRANETSRKGKGKGLGSQGAQQSAKMRRDEDEEDDRVQVAPNMVVGGSHPQATLDLEEEEEAEERQ